MRRKGLHFSASISKNLLVPISNNLFGSVVNVCAHLSQRHMVERSALIHNGRRPAMFGDHFEADRQHAASIEVAHAHSEWIRIMYITLHFKFDPNVYCH